MRESHNTHACQLNNRRRERGYGRYPIVVTLIVAAMAWALVARAEPPLVQQSAYDSFAQRDAAQNRESSPDEHSTSPVTRAPTSEDSGQLRITHVGMVAPNIIALSTRAGKIVYGKRMPYTQKSGDKVVERFPHRWVYRHGTFIGSLIGHDKDVLYGPDQYIGEHLPDGKVDRKQTYRIISTDDDAYNRPRMPIAIGRKTKPLDIGWILELRKWTMPTASVIYLQLPEPLKENKTYTVETSIETIAPVRFVYDPRTLRSDAVHVSHIGFHPKDPAKVAFLSTWMGSGGPVAYPDGLEFSVVDTGTSEVVFEGRTRLSKARGEAEDASERNFNGADVYEMDFHSLENEGEFIVVVDGIGHSYPFHIDRNVWRRAFTVSARGFYHQRSGIELGAPHTSFIRPRPFHPDDGVIIHQSTCPLMESKNGLNYSGRDKDRFGCIRDGKQDQTLTNAWGGYMDAGDWDRRIQHLRVSRHLLELANLFPDTFAAISLNIPESGDGLPDIISEALFNLDFFRRMQHADGGVPGGVESAAHPRRGERSWEESLDIMAYAPDVWSSHWYAATAARAAYVLRRLSPERAKMYEDSALKAMDYAERQWPRLGNPRAQSHGVIDARNMAAVELYRLTGEARWHAIFSETSVFKNDSSRLSRWPDFHQSESAWVYLRIQHAGVDEGLRLRCQRAIIADADAKTAQIHQTGFRWTKNPYSAAAWGVFSAPDAISIAHAHLLTADEKYLEALILASQQAAGANPLNMSYTTGIGPVYPRYVLHIDSRVSNLPPPPGLTVFGPLGYQEGKDKWGQRLADTVLFPDFEAWPTTEAYWDFFNYGAMSEYTVDSTMARNAYVWGYLAATPRT